MRRLKSYPNTVSGLEDLERLILAASGNARRAHQLAERILHELCSGRPPELCSGRPPELCSGRPPCRPFGPVPTAPTEAGHYGAEQRETARTQSETVSESADESGWRRAA
ncbi:MAG: hypothetical protein AMXMBFR13_38050 [Phycisphaerae bacterium]